MKTTSVHTISRSALGATLAFVLLLGCDSTSPVAPPGTLLTISANPARITSDGTSEIRVVAQKPNGTPVNPGTAIRMSTTIGRIEPTVHANEQGEAIATLVGAGEFGEATVVASVGGDSMAEVIVQVGISAASISLQTTPSSVSEEGGNLQLVALVRDDQGRPLPGAQVNFSTDIGTLDSAGRFLETDAGGSVSDTLRVRQSDIDVVTGDTFRVTAEVATGAGAIVDDAVTISIGRRPRAAFTFVVSGNTVVFTDTSTGRPTAWIWDFDDGGSTTDSTEQNPAQDFAIGTYNVRLTASNSQGESSVTRVVTVTGQ